MASKQLFREVLESMKVPDPIAVEDHLFEPPHPEVRRCLQEREKMKPDGAAKKKPAKEHDFEVKHFESFAAKSWQWPPPGDDPLMMSMVAYPQRYKEVAYFWTRFQREGSDAGQERVVDLHPTIDFGSNANPARSCPCIVATTKLFSIQQSRELTGYELLSLQGFDYEYLKPFTHELSSITHNQLGDLAGNAFNGYCLVPVTTNVKCGSFMLVFALVVGVGGLFMPRIRRGKVWNLT